MSYRSQNLFMRSFYEPMRKVKKLKKIINKAVRITDLTYLPSEDLDINMYYEFELIDRVTPIESAIIVSVAKYIHKTNENAINI